jgi:arylsulfatase A-like enzyme
MRSPRTRSPRATVLLLLALAWASACSPRPAGVRAAAGPKDVLVVVMDTLRQDRVGSYGYARDTTPRLDALAARGARFANARSTSTWTSPAHASLFTGLLPMTHGTNQERWDLFTPSPTLAEVLSAHGYRTVAAVGNPMLAYQHGFARGFGDYYEAWTVGHPWLERLRPTSVDERAVRYAEDRLAEEPDRPLFLFVNLIGIHSPYDSCGASCGLFGADPAQGVVENRWQDYYLGRISLDAATLRRLSDLYDAEVHEVDRRMGELVARFEAVRGARPQLVVVTSDHGENLGDHGHVDHVFSLYESTVRVPLVVLGEGFAPNEVVDAPVQLHDLFPTVLQAAGVGGDALHVQGLPVRSVPAERPAVLEYDRPVQATRILEEHATPEEKARLEVYQRRLQAIVARGQKLIRGDDGLRELYDLAADPTERVDLAAQRPTAPLELALDAIVKRNGRAARSGSTPLEDEETRHALQALGYLE